MLLDTLRAAQTTADVTRLFVQLGYRQAGTPYGSKAVVAARWRGFLVVAQADSDPRERARALARQLGAAGERGLGVGVGPGGIAIAAPRPGTAEATRALVFDAHLPAAVATAQLQALAPGRTRSALHHSLHVADVLSIEAVSNRFFRGFRRTWARMAEALPSDVPVAQRRLVALHSLLRMLFLYFVQAKGWLAGDPRYLRSLLDRTLASGGDFHRRALDPLFFGTLNVPLEARQAPVGMDIPYLNGGLFRRHPAERRLTHTYFPDELWIDVFEQLFDRYHFCVHEARRVDAVAPDMLGRVFERLMDGDERSKTGSFFTPEDIVHSVVREALTAALSRPGRLAPDEATQVMDRGSLTAELRTRAGAVVARLRILDPAVGSGAFLLGALEALTDIGMHLTPGTIERRWSLRRRLLRDNLFGIDLNPIAVRLAELRLWLAVVADDPSTTVPAIAPLPNLDGVIRQGNTLLDPLGAARAHAVFPAAATAALTRRVAEARMRLFDARGPEVRTLNEDLRRHELTLGRELLARATRSCTAALADLESAAESRDLFGERNRLPPAQQTRLRALRDDLGALERATASLDDGGVPFFSFEIHVPDVLEAGGFDLVIGNPPWVRAERIAPRDRAELRQRFRLWRASDNRGFRHLPDLAVAFVERALELVAPGGVVALLLPSKVASADYASELRQHLATSVTITSLHRISDQEAAGFGATTYPLALIARADPPHPTHAVRLARSSADLLSQHQLARPGPWILVPDRTRDAIESLRSSGRPLADVATPHLGVKTGVDGLLVGEPLEPAGRTMRVRSLLGGMVTLERQVLRPAVRGRDVRPFAVAASRVVLWAYQRSGIPRQTLPARAAAFVTRHAEVLAARVDYRGGPLWTLFRTEPALSGHRVVWRDIARRPTAAVLDQLMATAVPLNSCYVASFPDRMTALAASAVLNSCWAAALIHVTADEARGGYRRCNARAIGTVPLPRSSGALRSLAELAREAHHASSVAHADLDASVAQALGLPEPIQARLRALVPDRR
ncbi:MAG: hypothetical protein AMS20_02375 [Gemmatimonas sp. SG8_28]|nr:MAG: hypothetical protein AMS20_02375 [Gemmatimonas sp. SG8_28]